MRWLVALGAAFLVAVGVASTSSPVTGPIELVGTVTEYHFVRLGVIPKETWYWSLASSRRKGRPFGYGILACTYVSTKSSVRECVGTFSLPRGKITVAGSFLYPSFYELAVTGGTDLYVGAGGSVVVRRLSPRPSTDWIQFTLK